MDYNKYIQALKDYKDKIFEVHAKDTEVFEEWKSITVF